MSTYTLIHPSLSVLSQRPDTSLRPPPSPSPVNLAITAATSVILNHIAHLFSSFTSLLLRIPGSAIVLRYIKSSYQNDPLRSIIELLLFLFALRYLLSSSYSPSQRSGSSSTRVHLTNEEIESLIDEWAPEPLVEPLTPLEEEDLKSLVVVSGPIGPRTKLTTGKTVTNLATTNYFNLVTSDNIKTEAIRALRTYGVGPCGPPGFYGTQDIHMRLEADIAQHVGLPACLVFAQSFSTISSVIPAFAKRGDIIVADRAVNFSIRKGIQLSRSILYWYDHNDMDSLERVLSAIVDHHQRNKTRLTRRFIVTEALFAHTGSVIDLVKLVELKYRYKFRLILDESISYGLLGETGRGVTESQHVDPSSIDMLVGSLSSAIGAGGGFCAGAREVVEHQRINAASYTFSAALPAILATTAREVIHTLQTKQGATLLAQLRENTRILRSHIEPRSEYLRCTSSPDNPLLIFVLNEELVKRRGWSRHEVEWIMKEIVDECLSKNVLITRLRSLPLPPGMLNDLQRTSRLTQNSTWAKASDPSTNGTSNSLKPSPLQSINEWQPIPSLKVHVCVGLSRRELESAAAVIRQATRKVISTRLRSRTPVNTAASTFVSVDNSEITYTDSHSMALSPTSTGIAATERAGATTAPCAINSAFAPASASSVTFPGTSPVVTSVLSSFYESAQSHSLSYRVSE